MVVQDIEPLDLESLVAAIAQPRFTQSQRLRVSLIGSAETVAAALTRYRSLAGLLSSDEETAVGWRNQRLRTIAVVTHRPLAKAASLREFRVIDERDLARRLCAEQRDAAEVTWLRTLWDALERGRTLRISLRETVRFAIALDGLSSAVRSTQAPGHLHILGLFPDAHLADERSEQRLLRRLTQNRELAGQVRRATDEDWSRLRAYCKSLAGTESSKGKRLLRRLREVASGGSTEGIDLTEALPLWRGKVSGKTPGGGVGGGNGPSRVEVERVVGRRLLTDDTGPLGDIAEELKQIVQVALEDDARSGTQDVKQASTGEEVSIVQVDRDLLELVRSRSTGSDWGGVIEVASEKPVVLTEVAAFKTLSPFCIEPIEEDLAKFVKEGIAPSGLLDLIADLKKFRAAMVPHAAELAISPVAALAGEPGLLEIAKQYLATYEQLLRQLHGAYREMHAAADFEAERLVELTLCLELYVWRCSH